MNEEEEKKEFPKCERCGGDTDKYGCLDTDKHEYTEKEALEILLSAMFK